MRELLRLLRYVRPYLPPLLLSVLLMAGVGAAQGLIALLIRPVFDRVLNPASVDAPVALSRCAGRASCCVLLCREGRSRVSNRLK